MPVSRKVERDTRDYDLTSLRYKSHGVALHRDYSAHFFRWSFARRFIKSEDTVLDIGCGVERPLYNILFSSGPAPRAKFYVGVDLNRLKFNDSQRAKFYSEFDFVTRWPEIANIYRFDVIICFEVVEHINSSLIRQFLNGCYECLKPGGYLLLSTPVYDGKRHAANHIHEYGLTELRSYIQHAGFMIKRRFGTFMDLKYIGTADPLGCSVQALNEVKNALSQYYDNDAISCIFAPLYPDFARNNLWVCEKVQK